MVLSWLATAMLLAAAPSSTAAGGQSPAITAIFVQADRNRDGFIDPSEALAVSKVRKTVEKNGVKKTTVQPDASWTKLADRDRDGRVSRAEFVSFMVPAKVTDKRCAGGKCS